MSKSTTGAYGHFPDYYYERGNQFGLYLSGKQPRESWDDRHEHAVDGGHAVVSPRQRRPRRPSVANRLSEIVSVALTEDGASRILSELSAAHGFAEQKNARGVKAELVAVLTTRLTVQQQRFVLERLEAGAAAAYAKEQARQKTRQRRRRIRKPPSQRERQRSAPATNSAARQKCALCGKRVTKAQAKTCLADPLLMGHVYCIDDVRKVRLLWGGS